MLSKIASWLRAPEPGFHRGVLFAAGIAFAIALLAGALRYRAMEVLPMDWDELVYLRVAYVYAHVLEEGDWERISEVPFNPEHPPLVKLAYGLAIAGLDRDPPIPPQPTGTPIPVELREEFRSARLLSVAAGTAQVFMVALINPFAGVFLALDSYHIRYTSEIMLEAIPGFFAVLAVVLFSVAWRRGQSGGLQAQRFLLMASAVSLGLATSGKYIYALVALAMVLPLVARARGFWTPAGYITLSLATFFASNPSLWSDPASAIAGVLSFHANYSADNAQPWWHSVALLAHVSYDDHHARFFTAWPDRLLLIFGALGVARTARQRPVWFLWAILGMLFLIAWPTKWAHYPLVALPAFAMCAGYGVQGVAGWIRTRWIRLPHPTSEQP